MLRLRQSVTLARWLNALLRLSGLGFLAPLLRQAQEATKSEHNMGKRKQNANHKSSEAHFAQFNETLSLGGHDLDVYVLNSEDRVLSMRGMVRALTGVNNAVVEEIPEAKPILPLVLNGSFVEGFLRFIIPGNPQRGPARKARGVGKNGRFWTNRK